MRKNIILCGVGGQGIVLTSKLLAAAAMAKGIPVMSAETIAWHKRAARVQLSPHGRGAVQPHVPQGHSRSSDRL